jgi:hypothetical protein
MFGNNSKKRNNGSSPLMAEEETGDAPTLGQSSAATSNLFGGGLSSAMDDLEDQSPLERLIARSTLEQRGNFIPPESMGDTAIFRLEGAGGGPGGNHPFDASVITTSGSPKPSLLTLCAATCWVLQIGFVWSSFLAPSWFDTHLLLSVSTAIINKDGDQLLHSTSLASLLSDLNGADEGPAAMFLIVTSLILPCLFFVVGPMWTFQDRKEQDLLLTSSLSLANLIRWKRQHSVWYSPRRFLEYILRVSFAIFFLLSIIDIGTSSIEMNNSSTKFTLINQLQGGLACYTLGMTCALVATVLLRAEEINFYEHCSCLLQQHDEDSRTSAPPNNAFSLPWNIVHHNSTLVEAEEELQAPLLDNMDVTHPNAVSSMQIDATPSDDGELGSSGLPLWKRALLYELAIGATVLWVPALFMPLFELSYGGIISDFMSEETFSIRFWEFPAVIWQRGVAAGTEQWVLIILGIILIFLVYVMPLLATLLAIAAWTLDPIPSAFCRNVLKAIQPCLGGVIFYVALHFAVPAFEDIAEYAIDMGSSGLCKKFEVMTSDTCLTITGTPQWGFWFLLAQSLSLEILVALTLLWKY